MLREEQHSRYQHALKPWSIANLHDYACLLSSILAEGKVAVPVFSLQFEKLLVMRDKVMTSPLNAQLLKTRIVKFEGLHVLLPRQTLSRSTGYSSPCIFFFFLQYLIMLGAFQMIIDIFNYDFIIDYIWLCLGHFRWCSRWKHIICA